MTTKIQIVKAVVFPIVMYEWVSWTVKKAEGERIDAFELGYLRRYLRVLWMARRSNQSILKEITVSKCCRWVRGQKVKAGINLYIKKAQL